MTFLVYTYDWEYIYISLVCVFKEISHIHIVHVSFFRRKKSCILGVSISWSCTHVVVLGFNEWTHVTLQGTSPHIL